MAILEQTCFMRNITRHESIICSDSDFLMINWSKIRTTLDLTGSAELLTMWTFTESLINYCQPDLILIENIKVIQSPFLCFLLQKYFVDFNIQLKFSCWYIETSLTIIFLHMWKYNVKSSFRWYSIFCLKIYTNSLNDTEFKK